jgi:hypothetical protein
MSGSNSSTVTSGGSVTPYGGITPIGQLFQEAFTKIKIAENPRMWDLNPQVNYVAPPTTQDLFPYIVQGLQQARLNQFTGQLPNYSFGAARFVPTGANQFLVGQIPQLIYSAPQASATQSQATK